MLFSNFFIETLKKEIDVLEIELDHQYNDTSISPNKRVKNIKKILLKIIQKKQILETFLNYILESNKNQNGNSSQ
jgi:hypothetical protein